jgi:hypothetical protein
MGRILTLVAAVVLSCLLVTGLVGLTKDAAECDNVFETEHKAALRPSQTAEDGFVSLPSQIPGTSLVAEQLVCYEGAMLEDRSDEPVGPALALILRNTGALPILRGEVILERAGERYVFRVDCVMSGMSVMVIEGSAATYVRDGFCAISGWEEVMKSSDNLLDDLKLTHLDLACIEVRNMTDAPMENITLYHKNYLPEGIFIGGITYKTHIPHLAPNQSVLIYPEHYAEGYSRIFYAQ